MAIVVCSCCGAIVDKSLDLHHYECPATTVPSFGGDADLALIKLNAQLRRLCIRQQSLAATERKAEELHGQVRALQQEVRILKSDLASRTSACPRCEGTVLKLTEFEPAHGIFEYTCRGCGLRFRGAGV